MIRPHCQAGTAVNSISSNVLWHITTPGTCRSGYYPSGCVCVRVQGICAFICTGYARYLCAHARVQESEDVCVFRVHEYGMYMLACSMYMYVHICVQDVYVCEQTAHVHVQYVQDVCMRTECMRMCAGCVCMRRMCVYAYMYGRRMYTCMCRMYACGKYIHDACVHVYRICTCK